MLSILLKDILCRSKFFNRYFLFLLKNY